MGFKDGERGQLPPRPPEPRCLKLHQSESFLYSKQCLLENIFKEVSCLSQLVVKRVGGGSLQKEAKRKRGEMKVVMDNFVCGVLLRTVLQHGCKQSR